MSAVDLDSLDALVRLDEPDFYLGDPHGVYRRLRREAPVFWYARRGVWALSRYEDVRHVLKTPELFSSASGVFLQDANKGEAAAADMFGDQGEQMGFTDPPRHRELRRIVAPQFTPHGVARLEAAAHRFSESLLERIVPGEPFDFVKVVAEKLPVHMACSLLGLPGDNIDDVLRWSDELERVVSVDMSSEERDSVSTDFFAELSDYLRRQLERKRAEPAEDFLSMLLASELDNDRLSEANVMMFAITMIAAGNDTTRALISGIAAAFARHPEQLATLVADPSLVPAAIEEALRWTTPGGRGFLRTVTTDTEVSGQEMTAGQHVYVMLDSANRDPEFFPDPDPELFDITRPRGTLHVAFGFGTHVCIGAPLVRMETKILLEKMIERFSRWSIAGAPAPTRTVLRNGFVSLPVVFER